MAEYFELFHLQPFELQLALIDKLDYKQLRLLIACGVAGDAWHYAMQRAKHLAKNRDAELFAVLAEIGAHKPKRAAKTPRSLGY